MKNREKFKKIILLIIKIILASIFIFAGVTKLISSSSEILIFESIGIGLWFMYLIGSLEILGSIGLFFPSTYPLSIGVLIFIMFGAVYTRLFIVKESFAFALPLFLLIVLIFLAWEYLRR